MALVWQCDRCDKVSDMGDVDDPPEGWERRTVPVRGSEGARSSAELVICAECDDSLYQWLHNGDDLEIKVGLAEQGGRYIITRSGVRRAILIGFPEYERLVEAAGGRASDQTGGDVK